MTIFGPVCSLSMSKIRSVFRVLNCLSVVSREMARWRTIFGLCQFIYRNLPHITKIACTLDTHTAMQIFHEIFWINDAGEHPLPLQTLITAEDIETGKWRVNPAVVSILNLPSHIPASTNTRGSRRTASTTSKHLPRMENIRSRYGPYHAMLGGIGHAVVSAVDEALLFPYNRS